MLDAWAMIVAVSRTVSRQKRPHRVYRRRQLGASTDNRGGLLQRSINGKATKEDTPASAKARRSTRWPKSTVWGKS